MVTFPRRNGNRLKEGQQCLNLALVMLLWTLLLLPVDAFHVPDTFPAPLRIQHPPMKTRRESSSPLPILAKQDDEEDVEEEKKKEYRPSDDPTLNMIRRQQQPQGEEKDPFVFKNMVYMDKINQAIRATAIGFILAGILLNQFGYDFIVRDGKLTIDTLEKKQFETEVVRVMKSDAKKAKEEAKQSQSLE